MHGSFQTTPEEDPTLLFPAVYKEFQIFRWDSGVFVGRLLRALLKTIGHLSGRNLGKPYISL